MSAQQKPKKAMNPEEKLQAAVGLEINRRLMREHAKFQADAVAVAKWESTMGQRDALAEKKRDEERMRSDFALKDRSLNAEREQRLVQLFKEDDAKYEKELSERGMAFRRDIV